MEHALHRMQVAFDGLYANLPAMRGKRAAVFCTFALNPDTYSKSARLFPRLAPIYRRWKA
jgi:hypothetical protein